MYLRSAASNIHLSHMLEKTKVNSVSSTRSITLISHRKRFESFTEANLLEGKANFSVQ